MPLRSRWPIKVTPCEAIYRPDTADAGVEDGQSAPAACGRLLRLDQIPQHLLRVGCRRCGRVVEIQKVDAARLYGPDAIWRDVGQRLLDNTCSQRTGRHEEDGCWPQFE
jgi:hypothetical protein